METITHISSPYSEPWVAWLLFGLMLLIVLNRSTLINLRGGLRTIFSHSERTYGIYTSDFLSDIVALIFRVGILALTVYMLVYSANTPFTLPIYAKIVGIVVTVLAIQVLLIYIVGKIFLPARQLSQALEQCNYIRHLTDILLWVAMLLIVNWSSTIALYILCGVVELLFAVAIVGKGVQMFCKSASSLFYILLYFISLEVVPLCGTLLWAKHIV